MYIYHWYSSPEAKESDKGTVSDAILGSGRRIKLLSNICQGSLNEFEYIYFSKEKFTFLNYMQLSKLFIYQTVNFYMSSYVRLFPYILPLYKLEIMAEAKI